MERCDVMSHQARLRDPCRFTRQVNEIGRLDERCLWRRPPPARPAGESDSHGAPRRATHAKAGESRSPAPQGGRGRHLPGPPSAIFASVFLPSSFSVLFCAMRGISPRWGLRRSLSGPDPVLTRPGLSNLAPLGLARSPTSASSGGARSRLNSRPDIHD